MVINPNMGNISAIRKKKFIHYCYMFITAFCVFMLFVALGFPQTAQKERLRELNSQVEELMDQQKYFEATPIAQEALKLAEEIFGPEHVEVANALYNLGNNFYWQREFDEAEPLIRRSLAIYEKTLGPEHPEVAKALNRLGAILFIGSRNYDEAEKLQRRSLAIYEKAYGPEHLEVAKLLSNLAMIHSQQGDYAKAETLYRRSLNIREKLYGEDHEEVADSLIRLARLYEDQRKFDEAEQLYRRSLAIKQKAFGEEHSEVGQVLYWMAWLYRRQFKYSDEELFFQRALHIYEKAYGKESPQITSILNNLAGLYSAQRKFDEAERLIQRNITIKEKAYGTESPRLASELNNLANLYLYQGKYNEAEPLLQRALQIREKADGPEDFFLSIPLSNLAWAYIYQGKYEEAEPLLQRALKIQEKAYGPDCEPMAFPLYSLAQVYFNQKKNNEAELLLQRAIGIYEKASKTSHPNVSVFLKHLSDIYISQGKYNEAEMLLKRALDIFEKSLGSEHPNVADVLLNFARLYYAQGLNIKAQDSFDRCLQSLTKQFEYHFTYMSEKDRLLFLDKVSETFPLYFSFCFTYREQDPELIGEMYNVLLWQKGFVARSISALRSQIAASGDAEALTLLDRLTSKKTQLANLLISVPEDRDRWRQQVEQLEKEADELEQELVRRSSAMAEQKRLAQVTWRDVQKALKENEAAVEFVRFKFHDGKDWTDKTYYAALIVTPECETAPTLVILGEEEELEGAPLEEYRKLIGAKIRPPASDEDTLYESFWKPLEAPLAKKERIYLSPDGFFNLISWASLPAGDGRMLMEKYDIRTVSSTKDILREKPSHKATSAVLIGNPRFNLEETQQRAAARSLQSTEQPNLLLAALERGLRSSDQRGEALVPLPSTKEELQSIQSLLKKEGWQAEVFTEEKALEEAIKDVQSPRILHVATHGFFLPDLVIDQSVISPDHPATSENPMLRSGLYFAGADRVVLGESTPTGLEDGVLTAYEATGLNLHGTEFVVLSACETGLGEVKNGEGVFGLRRALQVAGAEAVLMSLWPVADQETQELMTLFYNKWLSGQDKYEAFREAQMELRVKVKERYGHDLPFYWAAFVLVGR